MAAVGTHLHTNNTENTENGIHVTIKNFKINSGGVGRAPSLRRLPYN
jgi:hypothetical protein